jgi:hypothetical protein
MVRDSSERGQWQAGPRKEKPPDQVAGTITGFYPPGYSDEGRLRPAKLLIEIEDGSEVHVAEWPPKNFDTDTVIEPLQLPRFDKADLENSIGKNIVAQVLTEKPYNGIAQYSIAKQKDSKFLIDGVQVGSNTAPAPTAQAPAVQQNQQAVAAKADPTPERKEPLSVETYAPTSRQEIGQATGNARNIASTAIDTFYAKNGELPDIDWLAYHAGLVHFYANYIMSPQNQEESHEEQAELVLSEDDILGKL